MMLPRDLTAELRIGGLIDLSHPALADLGAHIVMAEPGADCQRQHKLHNHLPVYPPAQYALLDCTVSGQNLNRPGGNRSKKLSMPAKTATPALLGLKNRR